jgi:hypothetical protein
VDFPFAEIEIVSKVLKEKKVNELDRYLEDETVSVTANLDIL